MKTEEALRHAGKKLKVAQENIKEAEKTYESQVSRTTFLELAIVTECHSISTVKTSEYSRTRNETAS